MTFISPIFLLAKNTKLTNFLKPNDTNKPNRNSINDAAPATPFTPR
jgi:hypothetical protein